jgi:polyketide synthase PksL
MFNRKKKITGLVSILQKKFANSPYKTAFYFLKEGHDEIAINYFELDQKAKSIATQLIELNLIGHRVLLLFPAGLDFIISFLSCLYAGAIAVPVYCPSEHTFEQAKTSLNAIAKDAKISVILTLGPFMEKAKEIYLDQVLVINTNDLYNLNFKNYQLPVIEQNVAYLQYSSGSTAVSKGIVIECDNLLHSLKYTAKTWKYSKDSVTLIWAPHYHVYGLVCGLLVPLYHGTPSVIIPTNVFINNPKCWFNAITKYKVSHSGCPNFGYELCTQAINTQEFSGIDLSSWKVAINGGEIVREDSLLKFNDKFKPYGFRFQNFCSSYGMSELTGMISATSYEKKPTRLTVELDGLRNNKIIKKIQSHSNTANRVLVSSGKLLPGLKAIIINPKTLILTNKNEVGEICLSGPSVAKGYWQRQEETVNVFKTISNNSKQFYCRTGDLGFIYRGEIFLTGRLKELIIIYGKNYYPLDLEIIVKNAHEVLKKIALNVVFFTRNIWSRESYSYSRNTVWTF